MSTILDYLHWRGDLTFKERPFNEVDNLILSELAYFDFDLVTNNHKTTIKEAYEHYLQLETKPEFIINDPVPLLEACATSKRYENVVVSHCVNLLDRERALQFFACWFHINRRLSYVAYRGTDGSLIGWREDFNITYTNATAAQIEATNYLNRILKMTMSNVLVGGHSKGGNLAVYAAAFCEEKHQSKITTVYNNDGPGFNEAITNDPHYIAIIPKVILTIPESSFIGIIFSDKSIDKQVIKSEVQGVMQHYPYTWEVDGDHFVHIEKQSENSLMLDETLEEWLAKISVEERKLFITTIFDVIDASGAKNFKELNDNKWISYNAILQAASKLDEEARQNILQTFKKLAEVSKDIVFDEAKNRFKLNPLYEKIKGGH